MNLAARLAWLLELAPPAEPWTEADPAPFLVACPALGSIAPGRCADTQDGGRLKACGGCPVGAELLQGPRGPSGSPCSV